MAQAWEFVTTLAAERNSSHIGAEYAVSLEEQENQVDSLTALDDAVQEVTQEKNNPNYFKHLSIQVGAGRLHAVPSEGLPLVCWLCLLAFCFSRRAARPNWSGARVELCSQSRAWCMRTEHMKAYVGDDGALHLVADRSTLKEQIYSLDLERARMLTKVGHQGWGDGHCARYSCLTAGCIPYKMRARVNAGLYGGPPSGLLCSHI
eukprot:1142877-Pelagomonas_calceolata.AAC.7